MNLKKTELFRLLDVLKEWLPMDASIAITNSSSYIHCQNGTVSLPYYMGQKIEQESIARSVLQHSARIEIQCCEEEFGTRCVVKGYPISLNGEDGAVLIFQPIEKKIEPLTLITGKTNDLWKPVQIDHIYYFESKEKKTWFCTKNDAYRTDITLKELPNLLPSNFLRIHRSFIINILFIKEISRDFTSALQVTLQNGVVLPVSQSYTQIIREKLRF